MQLSKPIKILVGLITFGTVSLPLLMVVMFVLMALFIILAGQIPELQLFDSSWGNEGVPIMAMMAFYLATICFTFSQLMLQVFYIVHAIMNKQVTDTVRILVVLAVFFVPIFAMPLYFAIGIWFAKAEAPAISTQPPGDVPAV
jgi:hypothetical protein